MTSLPQRPPTHYHMFLSNYSATPQTYTLSLHDALPIFSPREHVDRYSAVFRNLWNELGISYTHFIRTTSAEHLRAVRRLLLRARDTGYIYKGFYQGRYCVYDNLYVSDSTDAVDCPLCGRPAEVVSEENYFFKLSAFQERLLKLYEEQPDFIRPAFRRTEVQRFVEAGLRDISVSRKTVKWGLP